MLTVACLIECKAQEEGPAPIKKAEELSFKHSSFTFVRIRYSGDIPSSPNWFVDYPDADLNFAARFKKVTGLKTDPQGKVMELTNTALKRYPFIYISGAEMQLSASEVAALHDYLEGGGFLMVDDFWGEREWKKLAEQMKKVFPNREPVELPIDHPLFRCFYDIREKPQVPNVGLGIQSEYTGVTWEREDAKQAYYRGLMNDKGRLMAVFCHNTDLADGWERESKNEYWHREFSMKKAYPMGINIVVYALTQ
jgi:hypothetical protein